MFRLLKRFLGAQSRKRFLRKKTVSGKNLKHVLSRNQKMFREGANENI